MAGISGFYTIEMKVNGVDFLDPIHACSFALKQSLFDLYPILVLNFYDPSGIMNSTYMFENGSKIEIRLMTGDTPIFRSLFYVYKSETDEIKDIKTGGGLFTVKAIHVMAWKQYKRSRAFRDRISNIVETIGNEYGFQVDKNDTGNADVWYQCNISDGQFLMEQLLPNAWSKNAEGSPFFLYMDLQNKIHLRHLKSFLRKKSKYKIIVEQNTNTIIFPDGTAIQKGAPILFSYKRDLVDIFEFAKKHLIDTWKINRDNGNVNRKIVDCFNQPKTSTGNLLYMNANKKSNNLTGTGFTNTEVGKEENTKGQIYQQSRILPGIEKITMLMVFHTDTWLDLGDKIELQFFQMDFGTGIKSKKMTDDYLVVESDLMWDRDKLIMYQRLVLTRVAVNIPRELKTKSKFLKLEQKVDSTIQGD